MPKDTVEYLLSSGLKNALYSIRAADLTEELFGTLLPCPFQVRCSSRLLTHINIAISIYFSQFLEVFHFIHTLLAKMSSV